MNLELRNRNTAVSVEQLELKEMFRNRPIERVARIPHPNKIVVITPSNDINKENQPVLAGGHPKNFWLSSDGKSIFKRTSSSEIEFYKAHNNEKSPFYGYIPKILSVNDKDNIVQLENLTHGMKSPVVIDIKVGTHSFSGIKKPGFVGIKEAIERYLRWSYRDIVYGFRNRGWRVQGISTIKVQDRNKIAIHSKEYLADFVKQNKLTKEQLEVVSKRLSETAKILENNNYGFINSSIMIAVDKSDARVCFIDFAHTVENVSKRGVSKTGPIRGMRALSKMFEGYAKGK